MDPFDEFEIKPLSDGLGFHKKTNTLSEQIKKSGLIENQTTKIPVLTEEQRQAVKPNVQNQVFTDLLKSLEMPLSEKAKLNMGVSISEPLPAPGSRKRSVEIETPVRPNVPPAGEPDKIKPSVRPAVSPLSQAVQDVGLKRGAADSPLRMLESAPVAIASAVLDAIVIFALTLVFLVALMTVTKVDLAALLFRTGLDVSTRFAFAALLISVMMMYVVVVRSFFGRTLGEWTFDFQVGDDKQQKSAKYPLQILWRSIVVTATGVVVLPLLSLIFKKDIPGRLSGLQLYRSQ